MKKLATLLFLALSFTASANEPRYPDGGTAPAGISVSADGVILCIGMSQANWTCEGAPPNNTASAGWREQSTLPAPVVNGAISGWDTRRIMADPDEYWSRVEQRIRQAGYANSDVELIWGINATRTYQCPEPCTVEAETAVLQGHLEAIQDQAEARFPNLVAGFHSSRMYGGWCPANEEPFAHFTIDAVEGAVADESLWHRGPYIWAGETPRADGLFYVQGDFWSDGCHPAQGAIDKIVPLLDTFFAGIEYSSEPPPPPPPGDGATNLTATYAGSNVFQLAWQNEGAELRCGATTIPVSGSSAAVTIPVDLDYDVIHSCQVDSSNFIEIGCQQASGRCRVF